MPARKQTSSPKDSTAKLGFEAKLGLADGVECSGSQEKRVSGAQFGRAKRARRVRLRRKQPNQSNVTTRRLAIMNLAIRSIEADFGPDHADTFRRDLRADYDLANPPFNGPDLAQSSTHNHGWDTVPGDRRSRQYFKTYAAKH